MLIFLNQNKLNIWFTSNWSLQVKFVIFPHNSKSQIIVNVSEDYTTTFLAFAHRQDARFIECFLSSKVSLYLSPALEYQNALSYLSLPHT